MQLNHGRVIPRQWVVFPQLQIGAWQILDIALEARGVVLFDHERTEAVQCRLIAKTLAAELAHVQLLANDPHFGVTGIADVGVMSQTTAFDFGPRASSKCSSVSNMCVSRRFQDSAPP